jgi:hypothetical protein
MTLHRQRKNHRLIPQRRVRARLLHRLRTGETDDP